MGVQTDFDVRDIDESETLVCPVCGKPIDKDIKQCPYCKELIWDNDFDEGELIEKESDKECIEVEEAKFPLMIMLFIIVGLSGVWSIAYEIMFALSGYSTSYSIAMTSIQVLLSIYTILLFVKRKPNAVYIAVSMFVLYIFSNLFVFFDYPAINHLIRSAWDCIWIVFLLKSPGLKRMFPERKMFWWDWVLVIGSLIFLFFALFCK